MATSSKHCLWCHRNNVICCLYKFTMCDQIWSTKIKDYINCKIIITESQLLKPWKDKPSGCLISSSDFRPSSRFSSNCCGRTLHNVKGATESLCILSNYLIPDWSLKWQNFIKNMLSNLHYKGSVKCLVFNLCLHESGCMLVNVVTWKELLSPSVYAVTTWSLLGPKMAFIYDDVIYFHH